MSAASHLLQVESGRWRAAALHAAGVHSQGMGACPAVTSIAAPASCTRAQEASEHPFDGDGIDDICVDELARGTSWRGVAGRQLGVLGVLGE